MIKKPILCKICEIWKKRYYRKMLACINFANFNSQILLKNEHFLFWFTKKKHFWTSKIRLFQQNMRYVEKMLWSRIVYLNKFYKFAFTHFFIWYFLFCFKENTFENIKIRFFNQNTWDMKKTAEREIACLYKFCKFQFTDYF